MEVNKPLYAFFYRLPLFKLYHGLYIDHLQEKYDFLTYRNETRDWDKIHFGRPGEFSPSIISFTNILQKTGKLSYTCTERNLVNLFLHPERIAVNKHYNLKSRDLTAYAKYYKAGYDKGVKISVRSELGINVSDNSLSHEFKMGLIKEFCQLCHKYSYFEGFAIPECLDSIGYLQGVLFNAYKEFSLLKEYQPHNEAIVKAAKFPVEKKMAAGSEKDSKASLAIKDEISKQSNRPDLRITVGSKDVLKDIETLWSVLLLHVDAYPPIMKLKGEIKNILCQLFHFKSDIAKVTSNGKIELSVFETHHRSLIEFLMKFSKLRIDGNRQTNPRYCELLKSAFPGIYHNNATKKEISVKSINGHWMEKTNECLQILRQVQLPKQSLT